MAQTAERQLQHAAQQAERRQLLTSLLAASHQSRSIALTVIDARFAERRRLLALIADPAHRAAAERQLALEQNAERGQLDVQHRHAVRALRRAALQPLAERHRGERRALGIRQRHLRGVLGIILWQIRPQPLRDAQEPHQRLRIDRRFLRAGRRAT